jgi:hypothetical protein
LVHRVRECVDKAVVERSNKRDVPWIVGAESGAGSTSRRWGTMIGLRELAVVATVFLVLYGRSGVLKSRQVQAIRPWISPVRRTSGRSSNATSSSSRRSGRFKPFLLEGNRLFWFLTILAATAVAATIITRQLILSGSAPGITH